MDNYNILVTSSSKKVHMIDALRHDLSASGLNYSIFCGDISSKVPTRFVCDRFWHMPKTSQENFKEIKDFLVKNRIKIVIPTRDGELEFWALFKDELLNYGIKIAISSLDAIKTCSDKLYFYRHCMKHSLKTIDTFSSIDQIKNTKDFFVLKERLGAGSENIKLNLNFKELVQGFSEFESPIIQKYSEGQEFSVDCFVSNSGEVKAVIPRERVKVVDGESKVTRININQNIKAISKIFLESLNFSGHIVLQFIESSKYGYQLLECNPRFGGASTYSVYYGLRTFLWLIEESEGIESDFFIDESKSLTQTRMEKDILHWS